MEELKDVELTRFVDNGEVTIGRLVLWGVKTPPLFTIERSWRDNERSISCIPVGSYVMKLGRYHKGDYPAYEVMSVPGRTDIKFHIANTVDDVAGCIGVGLGLVAMSDDLFVVESRNGLRVFMDALGRDEYVILRVNNFWESMDG